MRLEARTSGVAETILAVETTPRRLIDRFSALAAEAAAMAGAEIKAAVSGGAIGPGQGMLARAVSGGIARSGDRVAVWVGPKPRAAFLFGYHDQGFHGTVEVRAHQQMGWQAFGRKYQPRRHWVTAYTRRIDYPGHHFLAPAAARAGQWLLDQLEQGAIDDAG